MPSIKHPIKPTSAIPSCLLVSPVLPDTNTVDTIGGKVSFSPKLTEQLNKSSKTEAEEDSSLGDEQQPVLPAILLLLSQWTALGVFFTTSLGLAILLGIFAALVRPFSRSIYRRLCGVYGTQMFLDGIGLAFPATKICITGDSDIPVGVGCNLIVANSHQIEDWYGALMLTRCININGHFKVFLTEAVRYSNPLLGLILTLLEYPFLADNWMASREELKDLLRGFAEEDNPIMLFMFPEGGEPLTANALAKSLAFARREGRPALKHLLLPRTTGFNTTVESLRESSPCVYDMTIAHKGYRGNVSAASGKGGEEGGVLGHVTRPWEGLWRLIRGLGPREVHLRIKRYSMEEVLQVRGARKSEGSKGERAKRELPPRYIYVPPILTLASPA